MGLKNRRLALWAFVLFLAALVLGVTRVVPAPTINIAWRSSVIGKSARYEPAFRVGEDRELVLVYIGSRSCAASNNPELPELV